MLLERYYLVAACPYFFLARAIFFLKHLFELFVADVLIVAVFRHVVAAFYGVRSWVVEQNNIPFKPMAVLNNINRNSFMHAFCSRNTFVNL